MSKMMMRRSDGKPPLARSPVGLRNRRVLQSTPSAIRTPPGSLTKTQLPKRVSSNVEEWELRPEYRTISCELRALEKMVQNEFGNGDMNAAGNSDSLNAKRSPLLERGKFYEEYSARRNERLRRRKGGDTGNEKKPVYDLGVRVEFSKKRAEPKMFQSARKSVASMPIAERRETPRYFLRSTASKENKKPPLPVSMDKSVGFSERTAARRVRKN